MSSSSSDDDDAQLEKLDAIADEVTAGRPEWSASESEFSGGSALSSSSEEEETEAAVGRKFRSGGAGAGTARRAARTGPPGPGPPSAGVAPSAGSAAYTSENDAVLHQASWQDLEEERRFLERTHRANLNEIIAKLENEIDDGDVVDLQTGRIIADAGHLRALAPQRGVLEEDSESEDDIEEVQDADESIVATVCQRPLLKLEAAIAAGSAAHESPFAGMR